MTKLVGLTPETFNQLTDDALVCRVMVQIARAMMSDGFRYRFTMGDIDEYGNMAYHWEPSKDTCGVTWTPLGTLNEMERTLVGEGYAAMVLFPAILATIDCHSVGEPHPFACAPGEVIITGPLLGTVKVIR